MKRSLALLVSFLILGAVALSAQAYKDGIYFAQENQFPSSGWKEQVVVTVKGGKITAVNWNGVNNLGVADKKTVSPAGGYGMEKAAKQGPWHVQAAAAEAFIVKNQGVKQVTLTADGHTDAIAGATLHVDVLVQLFNKAIAAGPVSKGIYKKDGWFRAEQATFDKESGWKDNALVTVVNGTIVDAVWNSIYKDSSKKSKLLESIAGNYGLEKASKVGRWDQQAEKAQTYLLKIQDPSKLAVGKDGHTDAIAGATIAVGPFFDLVSQALKTAR